MHKKSQFVISSFFYLNFKTRYKILFCLTLSLCGIYSFIERWKESLLNDRGETVLCIATWRVVTIVTKYCIILLSICQRVSVWMTRRVVAGHQEEERFGKISSIQKKRRRQFNMWICKFFLQRLFSFLRRTETNAYTLKRAMTRNRALAFDRRKMPQEKKEEARKKGPEITWKIKSHIIAGILRNSTCSHFE